MLVSQSINPECQSMFDAAWRMRKRQARKRLLECSADAQLLSGAGINAPYLVRTPEQVEAAYGPPGEGG